MLVAENPIVYQFALPHMLTINIHTGFFQPVCNSNAGKSIQHLLEEDVILTVDRDCLFYIIKQFPMPPQYREVLTVIVAFFDCFQSVQQTLSNIQPVYHNCFDGKVCFGKIKCRAVYAGKNTLDIPLFF